MIFKIADISIKVKKDFKPDFVFKKFLIFNHKVIPDIFIEIRHDKFINSNHGSILFNAPDYWGIYSFNQKIIVQDIFNFKQHNWQRIAIFDKNFKTGILKLKKIRNSQAINPLTYPIGPVLFLNFLPYRNGCFIHACGIKIDKFGILLSGSSGAGKSTLANLFKRTANIVLNDDRIILRRIDKEFLIYGCPWHTSEEKFIQNTKATLKYILFLQHGRKNELEKLNQDLAFRNILQNCLLPIWEKEYLDINLRLIKKLASEIDCFSFRFLPDESALEFLKKKLC